MTFYAHDCPDCSCLNDEGVKAWLAARLTEGDQDHPIYTADLYDSYLRWMKANNTHGWPEHTQNLLTRWMKRNLYRFVNKGGKGNKLIGHRWAD